MSEAMKLWSAVDSSNMAPHVKSKVSSWIEKASGATRLALGTREQHGMHAVRQYGEALLTGAALGIISAEGKTGLDVNIKGHDVPIDGGIAVLGFLGKIALGAGFMSGEDLASDLGNIGSTSGGIMTFRKLESFLRAKRAAVHGEVSGESAASTSEIERLAKKFK